MKIRLKGVLLLCLLLLLSACAVNAKRLNSLELAVKGAQCFGSSDMTIYTVPSRGAISDKLSIAAAKSNGNDGGFSETFKGLVAKGNKQFVFYSANSEKMSVFLQLALASFRKGELADVGICFVGDKQYVDAIAQVAEQAGAVFKRPEGKEVALAP